MREMNVSREFKKKRQHTKKLCSDAFPLSFIKGGPFLFCCLLGNCSNISAYTESARTAPILLFQWMLTDHCGVQAIGARGPWARPHTIHLLPCHLPPSVRGVTSDTKCCLAVEVTSDYQTVKPTCSI